MDVDKSPTRPSDDVPSTNEDICSPVLQVNKDGDSSLPAFGTPVARSVTVHNRHRKLFDKYFGDLPDMETSENEGITPLPASPSQHNSAGSSGVVEESTLLEARGDIEMRSVGTQRMSRSYVNKLIASGKLWTPITSRGRTSTMRGHGENAEDVMKRGEGDPKESEKPSRVVTENTGGEITIEECNEETGEGAVGEPARVLCPTLGRSECAEANATTPREQIPTSESDDQSDEGDSDEGEGSSSKGKRRRRRPFISFENVVDDADFEHFCGLSRDSFNIIYKYIGGDEQCSHLKHEGGICTPKQIRLSVLSYKSRLFMTLCRLRRGFTIKTLAILFGCSESLASRVISTYINLLYVEFKPLEEQMFQDRRSQARGMPKRLKSFKGLRIIVDGFEVKVQSPSDFQQQGNTWSSYKHCNTVKFLVGVNCRGAVIYISEAFEGSMSDKEVFMRSSLYEMLKPGDVVMADRGFDIAHDLDLIKVKLVIPSYLKGRDYLTPEEEIWSKKIARARIFVENAIGRIKTWRLLTGPFPQSTLPLVSQIVFVCACLTNFMPALIACGK